MAYEMLLTNKKNEKAETRKKTAVATKKINKKKTMLP